MFPVVAVLPLPHAQNRSRWIYVTGDDSWCVEAEEPHPSIPPSRFLLAVYFSIHTNLLFPLFPLSLSLLSVDVHGDIRSLLSFFSSSHESCFSMLEAHVVYKGKKGAEREVSFGKMCSKQNVHDPPSPFRPCSPSTCSPSVGVYQLHDKPVLSPT